ncbi:MAG: hypothetical protein JWM53_4331 [bacterium]|nr:hypothetical protein [bacterium]
MAKGCNMREHEIATEIDSEHHHFSVRLAGLSIWEEHLSSLELAHQSATEPLALGLLDVHITDEETGQCVE